MIGYGHRHRRGHLHEVKNIEVEVIGFLHVIVIFNSYVSVYMT